MNRMLAGLGVVVLAGGAACTGGGGTGGGSTSTSSSTSSSSSSGAVTLPALQNTTVLEDTNPDTSIVEVTLRAQVIEHAFNAGRPTTAYAYNGMIPGPTIQARQGNRLIVHFENQLQEPTTIHWHGLRIPDAMDGTPETQEPVAPGGTFTYDFILPDVGSFWFHPHYNTVEQIEKGLMGTMVVHEADPAQTPVFDAERIMFTDDIKLGANGAIAAFAVSGMDIMHGRAGNTLLLNGTSELPTLTVRSGTRERWRFFNGANGRTMSLSVEGATFAIISVDGGLLPQPLYVTKAELPIGARLDMDVIFDGAPGSTATLTSWVLMLDANNNVIEDPVPLALVNLTQEAAQEIRAVTLPTVTPYAPPLDVTPEKLLRLSGYNEMGQVIFTINDLAWPAVETWEVMQGTRTRVQINNALGMEHPFHLHGQFFHVIAPQDRVLATPGARDTILVPGGGSVTVEIEWSNPGMWMYHCHIPEHAEHGMMGHVMVTGNGTGNPLPGHGH